MSAIVQKCALVRLPKVTASLHTQFCCLGLLALATFVSSCSVNPNRRPATPTDISFNTMSCEQLTGEKARIEREYAKWGFTYRHGAIDNLRRLNGETFAWNDAARLRQCTIAAIQVPQPKERQPQHYHGSSNGT